MYICLCNALTDRKLRQAAATIDSERPADLYAACGCRAQCGRCVQTVLGMLREHGHAMEEHLQGAD
jgi:bacterioferritin-associated ferredoxin